PTKTAYSCHHPLWTQVLVCPVYGVGEFTQRLAPKPLRVSHGRVFRLASPSFGGEPSLQLSHVHGETLLRRDPAGSGRTAGAAVLAVALHGGPGTSRDRCRTHRHH